LRVKSVITYHVQR
jgi:hypothetical protein